MRSSRFNFYIRLGVVCILLLADNSYSNKCQPPQHAANNKHQGCDPEIWNYVWKPHRLHLIENCVEVSGIVIDKKKEDDGDVHIRLRPDKAFTSLLNENNRKKQDGCLVVEIICAAVPDDEKVRPVCEGYTNKVFLPKKGAHVKVTGSLVYDKHNEWIEIHPVTRIEPF